jgi:hypothetical protein
VQNAQDLLDDKEAPSIPVGNIVRNDPSINTPWSWHIDPASVEFADMTTEVCDGLPSTSKTAHSRAISTAPGAPRSSRSPHSPETDERCRPQELGGTHSRAAPKPGLTNSNHDRRILANFAPAPVRTIALTIALGAGLVLAGCAQSPAPSPPRQSLPSRLVLLLRRLRRPTPRR